MLQISLVILDRLQLLHSLRMGELACEPRCLVLVGSVWSLSYSFVLIIGTTWLLLLMILLLNSGI
jgi:hypothetical protein